MIDYQQYFRWPNVDIEYFYAYFLVAIIIAGYLVFKGKSRFKFELFFISFYLLTGNLNRLLTIKIPGIDLFEIQPIRFLFFLLSFFILRKTLFSREKFSIGLSRKVPWFMVALIVYVIFMITSVLFNSPQMEIKDVLAQVHDALAFMVLVVAIGIMREKPSYDVIGRSIIITAVFSSIVSLIQIAADPYFLRIGIDRKAFGTILRSNGIFSSEYFNSYFLITALAWTLITVRNNTLKYFLVSLFTLGVISSFQRMSWIVLAVVIFSYLIYVQRIAIEKIALLGLSALTVILIISLFYARDIQQSALVKERLTDTIEGRMGYYNLVMENIGKKPLLGYGDLKNEVYYKNMLRITGSRDRAMAIEGDLHSGYFSSLYLYGIPAFLWFTAFVILAVAYYARQIRTDHYFVIPFLVSILFLIGNLTNTFIFLSYISILFAVHIGIGTGLKHMITRTSHKA